MFSFAPKQKRDLPAASQIQAKSLVNKPGDRYEQEADQVAERVMRTGSRSEANEHLQSLPGSSANGGNPLPAGVRDFMEPRLGFEFGQVRIHADIESAHLCRNLEARAF